MYAQGKYPRNRSSYVAPHAETSTYNSTYDFEHRETFLNAELIAECIAKRGSARVRLTEDSGESRKFGGKLRGSIIREMVVLEALAKDQPVLVLRANEGLQRPKLFLGKERRNRHRDYPSSDIPSIHSKVRGYIEAYGDEGLIFVKGMDLTRGLDGGAQGLVDDVHAALSQAEGSRICFMGTGEVPEEVSLSHLTGFILEQSGTILYEDPRGQLLLEPMQGVRLP